MAATMKHFKHFLFLSILCSLVLFTNCGEDSEDAIDARDIYIGKYDISEKWVNLDGNFATMDYVLTVEKSSTEPLNLYFYNIGKFGNNENAKVQIDGNSFDIPQQNLDNGYGVSGTGSINGEELIFNYINTIDGYSYSVEADGKKK
tara:strand:+ start:84 stop:521 length:438 start_codon:yes stop_codon:yes gene_type:complete